MQDCHAYASNSDSRGSNGKQLRLAVATAAPPAAVAVALPDSRQNFGSSVPTSAQCALCQGCSR